MGWALVVNQLSWVGYHIGRVLVGIQSVYYKQRVIKNKKASAYIELVVGQKLRYSSRLDFDII